METPPPFTAESNQAAHDELVSKYVTDEDIDATMNSVKVAQDIAASDARIGSGWFKHHHADESEIDREIGSTKPADTIEQEANAIGAEQPTEPAAAEPAVPKPTPQ